jgi:hypothetical protein
LKNPANNIQEEECCSEAFEEDLRSPNVIFKPADLPDFQIAADRRYRALENGSQLN